MSVRFSVLLFILFCFSCSNSSQKILYIADAMTPCVGVSAQDCLQIKEEGTGEWQNFYDNIEGFNFQQGIYYKIRVAVSEVENPPADGSSLKYELIEILAQSNGPLVLDNGAWMVTRVQNIDSFGRNPFIRLDRSKNQISGNTGCNRFSATIEIVEEQVSLSNLSSTEMMCREMNVENAFLTALNQVATYKLADNKLQFLNEHQKVIIEADYLKSE